MNVRSSPEIASSVAAIRKQRGLSASTLASQVGVSRQTIYAIEAGTYVPNTAVGLRLARALETSVEDLFQLSGAAPDHGENSATLIASSEQIHAGQPVQLCLVDGRLIATAAHHASWYLPLSDGILDLHSKVQSHHPAKDLSNRVLIAGCDPAMSLLARHLRPYGIQLVLAQQNSTQALSLLEQGHIHIAGTHLSNRTAVRKVCPLDSLAVVTFAAWEEGIVVASGNPKGIRGVQDFARKGLRIVNREPGAGSRLLLDKELKRLGIESKKVRGYTRTVPGHLAAAWAVKTGVAECSVATGAAARVFGLDFLPLKTSRYDLVLRKHHLGLPSISTLLDAIHKLSFRQELNNVAGYDTCHTGGTVRP